MSASTNSATAKSSLFARKTIESLTGSADDHHNELKRTLGAGSLIALGIGGIIGAGIFSLTGVAAATNAGPAVILSFIIAAIGCGFAALCYSELASMIPIAGSAYTYAYASLGELVAWIIGWALTLEYAVGASTVSVSWSSYVNKTFETLGVTLPHALTASPFETMGGPGIVNLPAIIVVCLISLLLVRGISESATVNSLIVVLKVAVVLTVIFFGAFYVHSANWHPFIPPNTGERGHFGISGILQGAGTIFFAYIGFDAVSTAAQETRNPGRDMPIGIMGSLAVCTVLYIAFSLVLTGLLPYTQLGSASPVNDAIQQTPYVWLHGLVDVGAIAGLTSVILVMLLGQSRVFYSMAKDGLLPKIFCAVHPTRKTPWLSHLLFMVMASILGGFLPIQQLGHLTSIGTLLAFVIVCVGVLVLRQTDPDHPRVFRVPFGPIFPIAGILSCGLLMVYLPGLTWIMMTVWLAAGLMIYFLWGRHNSVLAKTGAGR